MAFQQMNTRTVRFLYDALARGDSANIVRLLVADLEWWFHGPPRCNHMMRVLTGETAPSHFKFVPHRVTAIGDHQVIAEGGEGCGTYWVHVWTIEGHLITHFREYFNTMLVVKDVFAPRQCAGDGTLWQSKPRGDDQHRSLPELVLAV